MYTIVVAVGATIVVVTILAVDVDARVSRGDDEFDLQISLALVIAALPPVKFKIENKLQCQSP